MWSDITVMVMERYFPDTNLQEMQVKLSTTTLAALW